MTPKATTLDFFREIFLFSEGTVPIVRSNIETGEFPCKETWHTVEDITSGAVQLEDSETPLHLYFTPHTYNTSQSRHKRNASPTGSVVWIECDDEYFSFLTVAEAQPSIVVQTSPGRQHIYWLLDKQYPLADIEEVNKALTYKYLKHDRSGWDISQLLRVPGYKNRKREVPNDVEIVEWEPGRRYNLSVFADLPVIDNNELGGSRAEGAAIPTVIPTRDEVERKYGGLFEPTFENARRRQAVDRSAALWFMYKRCAEMNMSPVECFALLRGSVNDKFSHSRYNGELELWYDIQGSYRMISDGIPDSAREQIEEIRRNNALRRDQKRQRIAEIVRKDLAGQGGFYYEPQSKRVVYFHHRRLLDIGQKSIAIRAILDRTYNVNPIADEFQYVIEHIRDYVVQEGQRVTLHDTCHYNPTTNIMYVDDNNGGMFRLDGNRIESIEMGVDDIMFDTVDSRDPIVCQPVREDNDESPLEKYVLSNPNFDTSRLSKEQIMFLIKGWLYSTFFLGKSKPMLVIEGTRGSGKSTMFKGLAWTLEGANADVTDISDGSVEEVRVMIRGKHHVFLDGLEDASKPMQNLLSTVSTGSQQTKRVLYTDNEQVTYDLNAALGITAMSIEYFRKDLLDRAIILTTKRFDMFSSIEDIQSKIKKHRPEIWTEILHDLNDMVARKETWVPQPSKLRMNNFVDVLRMYCEIKGRSANDLINFVAGEQNERAVTHDTLYEVLSIWLQNPNNLCRTLTAKQLHDELIEAAMMPGIPYEREVKTPKNLNWKLRDLVPNLTEYDIIEDKNKRGVATFEFLSKEEEE